LIYAYLDDANIQLIRKILMIFVKNILFEICFVYNNKIYIIQPLNGFKKFELILYYDILSNVILKQCITILEKNNNDEDFHYFNGCVFWINDYNSIELYCIDKNEHLVDIFNDHIMDQFFRSPEIIIRRFGSMKSVKIDKYYNLEACYGFLSCGFTAKIDSIKDYEFRCRWCMDHNCDHDKLFEECMSVSNKDINKLLSINSFDNIKYFRTYGTPNFKHIDKQLSIEMRKNNTCIKYDDYSLSEERNFTFSKVLISELYKSIVWMIYQKSDSIIIKIFDVDEKKIKVDKEINSFANCDVIFINDIDKILIVSKDSGKFIVQSFL